MAKDPNAISVKVILAARAKISNDTAHLDIQTAGVAVVPPNRGHVACVLMRAQRSRSDESFTFAIEVRNQDGQTISGSRTVQKFRIPSTDPTQPDAIFQMPVICPAPVLPPGRYQWHLTIDEEHVESEYFEVGLIPVPDA